MRTIKEKTQKELSKNITSVPSIKSSKRVIVEQIQKKDGNYIVQKIIQSDKNTIKLSMEINVSVFSKEQLTGTSKIDLFSPLNGSWSQLFFNYNFKFKGFSYSDVLNSTDLTNSLKFFKSEEDFLIEIAEKILRDKF